MKNLNQDLGNQLFEIGYFKFTSLDHYHASNLLSAVNRTKYPSLHDVVNMLLKFHFERLKLYKLCSDYITFHYIALHYIAQD
jgi:hypothetical protein